MYYNFLFHYTGAYAARLHATVSSWNIAGREQALYDVLRYKDHNILPPQVVGWSRQIANGMQFLHSHRIIHRDLKSPKYVMFTCKTPDSLSVKYLWFKQSTDTVTVSLHVTKMLLVMTSPVHYIPL